MRKCLLAILILAASGGIHAVDGVVEINQAGVDAGSITPGDGPGFPVSLNAQGSYRLTGNLQRNTDGDAIQINGANITLDLNGFTVSSLASTSGNGITVSSSAHNTEITNGTIRDFPGYGVFVTSSVSYVRALELRVIGNGLAGLLTQAVGSLVRGCTVAENQGVGIRGFAGSVILENVVYDNLDEGLLLNNAAFGSNIMYNNNEGNENPQVNTNFSVQLTANQCGDGACP